MKSVMFISFFLYNSLNTSCIAPEIEDLLTPLRQLGESCGYESCPAVKDDMLNVHVVPHTHGEMGYMRSFDDHYTGHDAYFMSTTVNMKRIFDYVITELWSKEHRKFTLSDIAYFMHWWKNRDPTVHRMVYQLIRQGRLIIVGGSWSMVDEATTSYQAIIDQYTYSLRKLNNTFMECGRPLVAWQADVFGHSKEYTSLVAQMGFDGLFINPISFDDELTRMRDRSLEFVWRGSDDLGAESDIYTHKLFDGYWPPPGFCFSTLCEDPLLVTSDSLFRNVKERVDVFIESMRSRQAPNYLTNNVMVVMGMRNGYHDAGVWFSNIDTLINEVNVKGYKESRGVNAFYSSPACYLKAVHNQNPILQTKQDDFFPYAYDKNSYFTGFYTSRPTFKYIAREGYSYLQVMKQLQVLANLTQFDKIYEELSWVVGAIQDHTVITGAFQIFVKYYYVEKMHAAIQRSLVVAQNAFNKFRGTPKPTYYYRCLFNISSCKITTRMKSIIVIYNPLGWPVSVPVRLPVSNVYYLVYDHQNELVKAAIMPTPAPVTNLPFRNTTADHELIFIAENVPPLGYQSYYIDGKKINRNKRSIIKKLRNINNKKYYIRQAKDQDNESLLNEVPGEEDNAPDNEENAEVVFSNVTNVGTNFNSVLTPKNKFEATTLSASTEAGLSTMTDKVDTSTMPTQAKIETTTIKIKMFKTTSKYNETVGFKNVTTFEGSVKKTVKTKLNGTLKVSGRKKLNFIELDSLPYEEDIRLNDIKKTYNYVKSIDNFIKNKHIRINLDPSTRKITNMTLSNGINLQLDIQFYFYLSDVPDKNVRFPHKEPGAYIFRALDPSAIPIIEHIHTRVYKNSVVEEIHCSYSDYASFSVKLYVDLPVVEVDWVIGPVPVDDGFGKDVFIRYTTDLVNNGAFYTDSNGRQTVKRLRDTRASFDPINVDPIAGNFYPVTSKIYIEDVSKNIRFTVFNDRAQGGASLYDGELDLMVHRRILTDDTDFKTMLNETYDVNDTVTNVGLTVRGIHYIYVTKADYKPNKIFEKKFAKELELQPKIFVSSAAVGYFKVKKRSHWLRYNNKFSGLKTNLPVGVHLLSLEFWNEGTLLVRLENYLERSDVIRSGVKIVNLKDLFVNIKIRDVRETTLGANIWLNDFAPLNWDKLKFMKNFNDAYGQNNIEYIEKEETRPLEDVKLEDGIKLIPQQIRTFVVWFDYIGMK